MENCFFFLGGWVGGVLGVDLQPLVLDHTSRLSIVGEARDFTIS